VAQPQAIGNNIDQEFRNPCDNPMIKKLFRSKIPTRWDFLEKETVDEIIFITRKSRNRLMLELMARGGMRIGEVLKLTLRDIQKLSSYFRQFRHQAYHKILICCSK
jgi:integrase/recombinase XerD